MNQKLTYVYITFAISFAIIITVSKTLFEKINLIKDSTNRVEHSHKVKDQIANVKMNLVDAESSQRAYLLTKKDEMLVPLTVSQKETFKELNTLDSLVKNSKKQKILVGELKDIVSKRYQYLYATINIDRDIRNEQFLKNIVIGRTVMQQFNDLAYKMNAEEDVILKQRSEDQQFFQNSAPKYLLIVLLVSCFFQILSFIIIIKALNKQREYQVSLENKIKDLNNTNAEVEQIAFVASHDLQEPLRKIRTFSDHLQQLHAKDLNDDGRKLLGKISAASGRMQDLLNDLINFTTLTNHEEAQTEIDLRECLNKVCLDLKTIIDAKKATIRLGDLPVVYGYQMQLHLLFHNLIDNSLKFSREEVEPIIDIGTMPADSAEPESARKYVKIVVGDNGIGFKREYANKIFIIFQRLHNQSSSLPGKGIGLAICKRIMINHNGLISANGVVGVGAKFNLFFPKT